MDSPGISVHSVSSSLKRHRDISSGFFFFAQGSPWREARASSYREQPGFPMRGAEEFGLRCSLQGIRIIATFTIVFVLKLKVLHYDIVLSFCL